MKVPKSTKRFAGDYGVPAEVQEVIISEVETHFQGVCLDASSGGTRTFADDDTGGLLNYYNHFYSAIGDLINFVVSTKNEYDNLFEICGKSEIYRFFDPPKIVREDRYGRLVNPPTSLNFVVLVLHDSPEQSQSLSKSNSEGRRYEVESEQLSLFS